MAVAPELAKIFRRDGVSADERQGKKDKLVADLKRPRLIDQRTFTGFTKRIMDLSPTPLLDDPYILQAVTLYDPLSDASIHLWANGDHAWMSANDGTSHQERIEFITFHNEFLGRPISSRVVPCLTVSGPRGKDKIHSVLLDKEFMGVDFIYQQPLQSSDLQGVLKRTVSLLDTPSPFRR